MGVQAGGAARTTDGSYGCVPPYNGGTHPYDVRHGGRPLFAAMDGGGPRSRRLDGNGGEAVGDSLTAVWHADATPAPDLAAGLRQAR